MALDGAEKMDIDLLCKGSRSPVTTRSPRSPLAQSLGSKNANTSPSKRWVTVADPAEAKEAEPEVGEGDGVFTVALMVAAVGEGDILADGSRKTKDILENISRFVSKEQNTTVQVGGQGQPIETKMRVFVKNSIEAKAVEDYIAMHPDQEPAAYPPPKTTPAKAVAEYDTPILDAHEPAVHAPFLHHARPGPRPLRAPNSVHGEVDLAGILQSGSICGHVPTQRRARHILPRPRPGLCLA